MKKVKIWLKEHKKEIIIAGAAAGGTALYWKREKDQRCQSRGRLTFGFLEGDEDYYDLRSKSNLYTNLNLHNPGYTVGDLGKVGAELMKNIPSLTKDVPIEHLNANFKIVKK